MSGRNIVTLTALAALIPALAGAAHPEPEFPYDSYTAVLEEFVDLEGMVDYRGLKADPARLNAFVRQLANLEKKTYEDWNHQRQIAFWINAYNALVLKLIIDNYPIEPRFPASLIHPHNSIRQIKAAFDGVKFRVMGRRMTLDDIEHETLREEFEEPRIHFALVCAAMSCPRLRTEPYRGGALDGQLDAQVRHFVRQADKFRIDGDEGEVHLSSILKWFGKDFLDKYDTRAKFRGHSRKERAVLNFISRHLPEDQRRYLERGDYDIRYIDYDWSLNQQEEKEGERQPNTQ